MTGLHSNSKQAPRFQEEAGAERTCHYALEAEKIHAGMYQSAKDAVDASNDVELGPVQICAVCGHTVEGDAPDACLICKSPREKFKVFA